MKVSPRRFLPLAALLAVAMVALVTQLAGEASAVVYEGDAGPEGDAATVRKTMLHDMSKEISASNQRSQKATTPKPTTKADVKAADETAKAAEAASSALHGAAGYAEIAARHLGSDSMGGVEADSASSTKSENSPVDLKPEDAKADPESSVNHKIIGSIQKALEDGGSEQEKMSKVKAVLKRHEGDEQSAVASSSTNTAETGITKKMLSDMEVNNEKWERRAAHPYTGTHSISEQDVSDAQATSIAAKAAHAAEVGASEKAHTAALHIKSVALLQKPSSTSAAHVDEKMVSDATEELKKTQAGAKPKGTFTRAQIKDAQATAKAAQAASDALHGSMGYAEIAARTLGSKDVEEPVSSKADGAVGGTDPLSHPQIHSGHIVDEAAQDEQEAIKAQEKAALDDKEQRETASVTADQMPEDGSTSLGKPKTQRIAEVLRSTASEEQKVQQIKKIVHAADAGPTLSSGTTDVHKHLRDVKDKLARSKAKIDNLSRMQKATAAVQDAARKQVTKAHGDVTKEAVAAGLAPKAAKREAAVAVNRAAGEATKGKAVEPAAL